MWTRPTFKIFNRHSGRLLAVEAMSTADSAAVQQYHDNNTDDQQWQLRPSVGRQSPPR